MGNGKIKKIFLAIALAVIANLLLGGSVSAKKIELNSSDIERIKLVLDVTKLFSSIAVSDDKLKTILDIATKGAESGSDITYGLVVLTSLNEMDFIDSVVSQRYKREADAYFKSILDERLNLRNYYKGIGFDLPRVLAGRITSPMAALTLNTFGITEKTITIFAELNVLKKEMLYDGLWIYFDTRKRGNESHEIAWEGVEDSMNIAINSNPFSRKSNIDKKNQFEAQFATLYEKWGLYVEMNKGVKKEFKEQVKQELQQTLALAVEEQTLAEKDKKDEISFLEKMKLTLVNLVEEAKKAVVKIQEIAGLGGAQVSQSTEAGNINGGEKGEMGEMGETAQLEIVDPTAKLTVNETQEILDDITEKIDILSQKTEELTGEKGETGETGETGEIGEIGEIMDKTEEVSIEASTENGSPLLIEIKPQSVSESPVAFNYGTAPPPLPPPEPATLKILISEVQISPIGERFVELYNPNSETVNLSDWYIQRKTQTGSDFTSFVSSPHFEEKTIGAFSYFLIASSSKADIILSLTLTEGNSLILKSPKREIIDGAEWGEIQISKSFGRKWSTTTQSYGDFEIQMPTPGVENQSLETEPEPEPEPSPESPSLTIVINEIAWMGTATSSWDEWLEFYNNAAASIDLAGWKIKKGDEDFIIISTSSATTTIISAGGFYLLERVEKATDIAADFIYGGARMGNTGEKLELRDSNDILIDFLDFSSGWPAGTSSPNYISMERISATSTATSTNWANNNLLTRNGLDAAGNKINGTPRAQNSVSVSSTAISGLLFDEFPEITLKKLGSPYIIQQSLNVPLEKTLKIEPGAVLKFNDSTEIEVRGNLRAMGTEAEKITFERNSTNIPENDRYRLNFIESQNSIIDNVNLIDGGRLTYVPFYNPWGLISAAIEADNSSISIKNSLITGAFPRGINSSNSTTTVENTVIEGTRDSDWFLNTFALSIGGENSFVASSTFINNTIGMKITGGSPRIENNIFQENNTPIYLAGGSSPLFLNNSAQNNGTNGIVVDGADIIADTVWQSNLPYVFGTKYIETGVTLTLKKGTIVKMGSLIVLGKIITEGILENPVVFTSISDDEFGGDTNNNGTSTLPQKGDWQQLKFDSLATSTLEGVRIRYGSGYCDGGNCLGAINLASGGLEIKNSWVEKNAWGIFNGAGNCPGAFESLKLTNVVFSENNRDIALPYGVNCAPP